MICKGICPTPGEKVVKIIELMDSTIEPDIEIEPQELTLKRKHKIGVVVFKFDKLIGMISTDLLGRFPIASAHGNAYILIIYCYTKNAILVTAQTTLLKGMMNFTKTFSLSGIIPVLQQMDNEINEELIKSI